MAVPDFQSLMLPLLQLASEGRATVRDCVPDIARRFHLTDADLAEMLPSRRQPTLVNRLHWARTYLAKAGLLDMVKRGVFTLSSEGAEVLKAPPERIDLNYLQRFEPYRVWRASTDDPSDAPGPPAGATEETPLERIEAARREIAASLADDLLARMLAGSPAFFEKAVVDLLVSMGYGRGRDGAGRRLGRSGDGGIDGVINEDALGLDAVYIQAKRYAPDSQVGRPAIQQFVGSLTGEGASKGVFVTTSGFTKEAERFVERIAQRIVLIDGRRLASLMILHGVGVRTVDTITLSEIDENFFAED